MASVFNNSWRRFTSSPFAPTTKSLLNTGETNCATGDGWATAGAVTTATEDGAGAGVAAGAGAGVAAGAGSGVGSGAGVAPPPPPPLLVGTAQVPPVGVTTNVSLLGSLDASETFRTEAESVQVKLAVALPAW